MATSDKPVALAGSERPRPHGSELIGPTHGAEHIVITVLVRARPDSEPLPDLEHWQRIAPRERAFLSVDEYTEKHGAAEKDLDAVSDFAKARHLTVEENHAGRRSVTLRGTVDQMNTAFGIQLNQYETPLPKLPRRTRAGGPDDSRAQTHIHHGYDGPVHLPNALIGVVTAVVGLDNRTIGAPAGTGDPVNANSLSVPSIAAIYNFPNPGAAGQTIGVIAPQNAPGSGASYLPSDINNLYFPSLAAGYQTPPASINDIDLVVGGSAFHNIPTVVQGITNTTNLNLFPYSFIIELTQDISTLSAIAQGADVNVYFTQNSEQGWVTFLQRVLSPGAEKQPTVVTCSFYLYGSDDAGSIGPVSSSGSVAAVMSGLFQSLALQGISVFIAQGDWGADDQALDAQTHVLYPASDPWVTSCGGTVVGDVGPEPSPTFSEYVWSDAFSNSPFGSNNSDYGATGGGVSANFPVPVYQTAAGLTKVKDSAGNVRVGRFVPDIAGMVSYSGFFVNGFSYSFTGTSCVAPLYAGLIAALRNASGFPLGVLNPTLYQLHALIFNDVTTGNNDSGDTPDSPYFTAGQGWDACTGWGSINGRRLLAGLAFSPVPVTATASGGDFGRVCVGSFGDLLLTINNAGFAPLVISGMTSSSANFSTPGVLAYPLVIAPGASIDLVLRFEPASVGPDTATFTIFSNDLSGPHTITVSGDAPAARLELVLADNGDFGLACPGSFVTETLLLDNSGRCRLEVTAITSSSADFVVPEVLSYPLWIAPGDALPVPVRFQPSGSGPRSGVISVSSSDPAGVRSIDVSGTGGVSQLLHVIADGGNFGKVCTGSFADEPLILGNSGHCPLMINAITSSSVEFLLPQLLSYPIRIPAGDFLPVPVRFQPTSFGPKSGVITVTSDDPASPASIAVRGDAPSGRIALTGSACFGGIPACTCDERVIAICNVGECQLYVSDVKFKRKNRHWRLINSPFPATLHPGSCLNLVIRYKATEQCPRSQDLIITSDDPLTPVRELELTAMTVWKSCGHEKCDDERRNGDGERHRCECEKPCCPDPCTSGCCDDDCEEEDDDR